MKQSLRKKQNANNWPVLGGAGGKRKEREMRGGKWVGSGSGDEDERGRKEGMGG